MESGLGDALKRRGEVNRQHAGDFQSVEAAEALNSMKPLCAPCPALGRTN